MVLWGLARIAIISLFLFGAMSSSVQAQTYGIELHNNLMPASGGMAGTSLSRPQDLQSAINGNPATLRQFQGTQFSFGGGFADSNYTVTQSAPLPLLGVTPFSSASGTPAALLGNIGLTQDLDDFGLPATMGMGFISNAGAGVDFRNVPASNGTSAQYLALDIVTGVGMNLTERLAIGASATIGTSFLDGPFVDLGGMTGAYGFRGTVGANYCLDHNSSLGLYWQSKKNFTFEDAVILPGDNPVDIDFDHPSNFGFGLANNSLMCGRLLVAADVLYKMHSDADTLDAIFRDQWCFQFGSQLALNERARLRLGYGYNENPMKDAQPASIGGVTLPDGVPAVRYVQGQFAAIGQHRITLGVGIRDFKPGIDFDVFGGYGIDANDQLAATTIDITGNYWIGFGLTWRFSSVSNNCSNDNSDGIDMSSNISAPHPVQLGQQ